jgi:hypothetical protein
LVSLNIAGLIAEHPAAARRPVNGQAATGVSIGPHLVWLQHPIVASVAA